jgi:hypothetical protein
MDFTSIHRYSRRQALATAALALGTLALPHPSSALAQSAERPTFLMFHVKDGW